MQQPPNPYPQYPQQQWQTPSQPLPQQPSRQPQKKNSRKRLGLILAAIVLVFISGASALYVHMLFNHAPWGSLTLL